MKTSIIFQETTKKLKKKQQHLIYHNISVRSIYWFYIHVYVHVYWIFINLAKEKNNDRKR